MLAHVVVQLGGVAGVHQRATVRDLEYDTVLLTFKQDVIRDAARKAA